jgi:hypothetical protein
MIRYKKPLILIFAYYVLVLFLLSYASSSAELESLFDSGEYLTPLIPFHNRWIQMELIFLVFAPISSLIGAVIGGYFLGPVLLFTRKIVLGSKIFCGIQERPQPQIFDKISRAYFPALMALSINFIILFSAPQIFEIIVNPEAMGYMSGFIVLLMFTTGIGTLFFSPTWFLSDAGIVYSNKKKVAGTDQPVEVRTIGGRFTDFLRGYAGIGVVFSYIQFLIVYFNETTISILNPAELIGTLVFFFGFPVFIFIAILPSLIILDVTKEHRIRFVRTVAEKMGITEFLEVSIEKVNLRSRT